MGIISTTAASKNSGKPSSIATRPMVQGTSRVPPASSSAFDTRSAPPELASNSPNIAPKASSTPTLASVPPNPV